jgi:hypothetical protein
LAVKNHLHSSSGVREVVSSTVILEVILLYLEHLLLLLGTRKNNTFNQKVTSNGDASNVKEALISQRVLESSKWKLKPAIVNISHTPKKKIIDSV